MDDKQDNTVKVLIHSADKEFNEKIKGRVRDIAEHHKAQVEFECYDKITDAMKAINRNNGDYGLFIVESSHLTSSESFPESFVAAVQGQRISEIYSEKPVNEQAPDYNTHTLIFSNPMPDGFAGKLVSEEFKPSNVTVIPDNPLNNEGKTRILDKVSEVAYDVFMPKTRNQGRGRGIE